MSIYIHTYTYMYLVNCKSLRSSMFKAIERLEESNLKNNNVKASLKTNIFKLNICLKKPISKKDCLFRTYFLLGGREGNTQRRKRQDVTKYSNWQVKTQKSKSTGQ